MTAARVLLAPGQQASITELPARFHLEIPSDLDTSTLNSSAVTNLGTATNVNFQIISLGSNRFELVAISADGHGSIIPYFNSQALGVSSNTDTQVTLTAKTTSAVLLKSFSRKFASEETKVEYVNPDMSQFFFSSGMRLYASTGGSFSNEMILENYQNVEGHFTKQGFLQIGDQTLFASRGNFDYILYVTDGTRSNTRAVMGPELNSEPVVNTLLEQALETDTSLFIGVGVGEYSSSSLKIVKINKITFSIEAVIDTPCEVYHDFGFLGKVGTKAPFKCYDSSINSLVYFLDTSTHTIESLSNVNIYLNETNFTFVAPPDDNRISLQLLDGRLIFMAINVLNGKFNVFVTDGTNAGTTPYGGLPDTKRMHYQGLFKGVDGQIYAIGEATTDFDYREIFVLNQATGLFSSALQLPNFDSIERIVDDVNFFYVDGSGSGGSFISSVRKTDGLMTDAIRSTSLQNRLYIGERGGEHFFKYSLYPNDDSYRLIKFNGTSYEDVLLEDETATPIDVIDFHLVNNEIYAHAKTSALLPGLYRYDGSRFTSLDPGGVHYRQVKHIHEFKTQLLFTADDDVSFEELWRFDPLTSTNEKLYQMGSSDYGVSASKFFSHGTSYFSILDDNVNGGEVWSVGAEVSAFSRLTNTYSSPKGVDIACEETSNFIACLNQDWNSIWSFNKTSLSMTEHAQGIDAYSLTDNYYNSIPIFSHADRFYLNLNHPQGGSPTDLMSFDGVNLQLAAGSTGFNIDYSGKIIAGSGPNVMVTNDWDGALITDGTGVAPFHLTPFINSDPESIAYHNGFYYAVGYNSSYDQKIWVTDGTGSGSGSLREFNPGGMDTVELLGPGVAGSYIFAADDTVNGMELWITDGTSGGTSLLKDTIVGSAGLDYGSRHIASLSSYAILSLYNGSTYDIWVTDNTPSGTLKVLSGADRVNSEGRFIDSDKVFFTTERSSDTSCHLHVVSGSTGALTSLMVSEAIDDQSYCARDFFSYNGKIYFLAHSLAAGIELWETDGTPGGTKIHTETILGSDSVFHDTVAPHVLRIGSEIIFWGYDPIKGVSVWKLGLLP